MGNPDELSVRLAGAVEPIEAPKSLIGSGWLKSFSRNAAILRVLPDATNRSLTQRAWERRALPPTDMDSSANGSSQHSEDLMAAIDVYLEAHKLPGQIPPADGEPEDRVLELNAEDPALLVPETQEPDVSYPGSRRPFFAEARRILDRP